MAARPNTRRTLEYGQRIASNQIGRLVEMISMAEFVISTNHLLTPKDVQAYKTCVATGKKQLDFFRRIARIKVPSVNTATARRRKRGRPSNAEITELAAARNGKVTKRKARKATKGKVKSRTKDGVKTGAKKATKRKRNNARVAA